MEVANWIMAIASSVSAIAVFLIWKQINLIKDQIRIDHTRSRNQISIELIREWVSSLERETSSARKLAEKLDENQTRALLDEKPLTLDVSYTGLVTTCLSRTDITLETENEKLKLPEPAVALIRWQVLSYLNSLESVLTAWRHNVGDRLIIEEQFEYQFDETKGYKGLSMFRRIAGHTAFPAIHEFEEKIKKKNNINPGHPPLGN